jgi:hypothetical protein
MFTLEIVNNDRNNKLIEIRKGDRSAQRGKRWFSYSTPMIIRAAKQLVDKWGRRRNDKTRGEKTRMSQQSAAKRKETGGSVI